MMETVEGAVTYSDACRRVRQIRRLLRRSTARKPSRALAPPPPPVLPNGCEVFLLHAGADGSLTAGHILVQLAVASLGAAFCYVHAEGMPQERLRVCREALRPVGTVEDVARLLAEAEEAEEEAEEDGATEAVPSDTSPCYVAFTSGSCGHPKGVVASVGNVSAYAASRVAAEGITPVSRILVASAATFDPAQGDVCAALHAGATLCVPGTLLGLYAEGALAAALAAFRPTHVTTTPLLWAGLDAAAADAAVAEGHLRCVCLGGEAMAEGLARAWAARARRSPHGLSFRNVYGVTEATVYQVFQELGCDDNVLTRRFSAQNALCGSEFAVCPSSHTLLVRGPGVALGYLDVGRGGGGRGGPLLQNLTDDEGWHRTGDVVSVVSPPPPPQGGGSGGAGGLIFLLEGREEGSTQVKVNGRRADLSEITHQLQSVLGPGVVARAAAAAVATPTSASASPRIEAFVSRAALREATGVSDELLAAVCAWVLRQSLPAYLVPRSVHVLPGAEPLPVTTNGKVDVRSLVARYRADAEGKGGDGGGSVRDVGGSYVRRTVAKAWGEELGERCILSDDTSWDTLGGDSLSFLRLIKRLRTAFGCDDDASEAFTEAEGRFGDIVGVFAPAAVMRHTTIGEQTEYFASAGLGKGEAVTEAEGTAAAKRRRCGGVAAASVAVEAAWRTEFGSGALLAHDTPWDTLGGDSLSFLRLIKRLRTAFGCDDDASEAFTEAEGRFGDIAGVFAPAAVMRHMTIGEQAEYFAASLASVADGVAEVAPAAAAAPVTAAAGDSQTLRKQPQTRGMEEGHMLLRECARIGDASVVQVLLERCGVDPDAGVGRGHKGLSPLHVAARNGHLRVCRMLVGGGASVNAVTEYGVCAGHLAASHGHDDVLRYLLTETPMSKSFKDANKQSLHHFAARSGRAGTISTLVELKVPLVTYDRWGRSPLHWAVINRYLDVLRVLIALEVPVNTTTTLARRTRLEKELPLDIALRMHPADTELHSVLAAAGAHVSGGGGSPKKSAKGHKDMIKRRDDSYIS